MNAPIPTWIAWPKVPRIISEAMGGASNDEFEPALFEALTEGVIRSRFRANDQELPPQWWRDVGNLQKALALHGGGNIELHHADVRDWLSPTKPKAGHKPARQRKDGAALQIEKTFEELQREHGRQPTTYELFNELKRKANISRGGAFVSDADGGNALTWIDSKGKIQILTRDALKKRLQRLGRQLT